MPEKKEAIFENQGEETKKSKREKEDAELFELLSPAKAIDFRIEKTFQDLPENFVVLFLEKINEYSIVNMRLMNYFSKKGTPGIYVTVNKPLNALTDSLNRNKIGYKNIFFVDAITRTTGETTLKNQNFFYVDSPKNLIDMSIAIETCIQKIKSEEKFLVFDSVSTMLVYNKPTVVAKFAHSVAGKVRAWKAKGILLMVESRQEEIMRTIAQFCDSTVEI